MSRRPIILIGDVGVGKSMFLRHLIKIDAADVLSESLVFYINFGKEPALETNLEEHVNRRLAYQLANDFIIDIQEGSFVRSVYNAEVNSFKKSIYGPYAETDPAEYQRREIEMLAAHANRSSAHLRRSLEHIRATHARSSVIILDNVDQRPPDFQDRVFLIAQSFAETWPATVFVALRPSTFYESRTKGSLTGYQPRVFTVSATRVDEVIARRLAFAKGELLKAKESETFPANLSLNADDLNAYLDALIRAFTYDTNLLSLLENLSGGNLRQALTFLSAFVGSGYVSTWRILDAADRGDIYTVPEHEVIRAIILGDYEYYDSAASDICNIFDIIEDDGREHFLLPQALAHIQRVGEAAGSDGFTATSEIFDFLQGLGFSQEQIAPHLERALAKRLLDAPPGKGLGGPLRITSAGSYMYKEMVKKFTYVDAMITDTPITDIQFRNRIVVAKSIQQRLDRVDIFCDYLDQQWGNLEPEGRILPFNWALVGHELRAGMEDVRFRAERAEKRRQ